MKLTYGDKHLKIHGTSLSRLISESGYKFEFTNNRANKELINVQTAAFELEKPTVYLKGVVDGARGVRGTDTRIIKGILAFCKSKGYYEAVEYIEDQLGRM